MLALVFSALFILWPFIARAHKPSDSYLNLQISQGHLVGQWDLAIRDLDFVLGLDSNDDGAITWREIKEHRPEITRYVSERLSLKVDEQVAPIAISEWLIDHHSDGAYVIVRFAVPLSKRPQQLKIGYQAFFDVDSHHRGLLRLESTPDIRTAIFSPARSTQVFDLAQPSSWSEWLAFVRQGVWHIWIGFDHILFLIALLLPSVLLHDHDGWRVTPSFLTALGNVLKIVTSFTVAHSLTLGLATLGLVKLPSRFVESAIAASVILAAVHNLFPLWKSKGWLVAFGFGLIHGFGFANVLAELGLRERTLAVALVGFNAGVELGQIAIVVIFLPFAYCLGRSWLYEAFALKLGSALIVLTASVWMFERMLNVRLFAF